MEYRERLGPEGFLDCLDCQDLVVAVVLRETEDLMETLDVLVWGWRVPWVPRVLMAHRAPQELGSLDLRVLEVLLENKVRCFFSKDCVPTSLQFTYMHESKNGPPESVFDMESFRCIRLTGPSGMARKTWLM